MAQAGPAAGQQAEVISDPELRSLKVLARRGDSPGSRTCEHHEHRTGCCPRPWMLTPVYQRDTPSLPGAATATALVFSQGQREGTIPSEVWPWSFCEAPCSSALPVLPCITSV